MVDELLVAGTNSNTYQVSLDGCFCSGCKQYYLDIAAPGRENVVGYECTIPQGGWVPGKTLEPLEVGNDIKMADELLVLGANGNHMSGKS